MGDFTFNGRNSAFFGLQVEKYPKITKPKKRIQSVTIPGRSGDLHLWDGSYEDVTVQYSCWWKNTSPEVPTADVATRIAEWLYTAPAGAQLTDTYNDQVFREATFIGPLDIENVLDRFGRVTISFKCSPKAYLSQGSEGIEVRGQTRVISNPTPFPTKPLLEITGKVSGIVTVNNDIISIRFEGADDRRTITVDCESLEAWETIDGQEVSRNLWVVLDNAPPTLMPNDNIISIDGGVESVKVYPRFYTL